jgi:hypothetical protein
MKDGLDERLLLSNELDFSPVSLIVSFKKFCLATALSGRAKDTAN